MHPAGRRDPGSRDLILTAVYLAISIAAGFAVVAWSALAIFRDGSPASAVATTLLAISLLALNYGNVAYLLARWGRIRRSAARWTHVPAPDPGLGDDSGLVTVLIPSYREDIDVLRQTVLSAALQDYADRRVVVLLDDPPHPRDASAAQDLDDARDLPRRIQSLLEPARADMAATVARARARKAAGPTDLRVEADVVADALELAAARLEEWARLEPADDHTARLFVELTYLAHARDCRRRADGVRALASHGELDAPALECHHRRLEAIFRVEVTTFERKRYANLSHEPNKAMNLNAYISLMGGRWQEVDRADGLHLAPAVGPEGPDDPVGLSVAGGRWLLTVDADSLLAHDYASRLITEMVSDEHLRTAVMQSPYLATPGAVSPIERAAGATTDIMHLVHQGSTHFDATYWVGANALLRVDALGDIAQHDVERGHPVRRYIQDRTVIEDTESTIDLVDAGWELHNYPAALAYSATPADYGALLIQRRRWANGGLIILPKLLRFYRSNGLRGRWAEAVLRVHYLVSTAAVTFALLALTLLPVKVTLPLPLLAVLTAPYFLAYAGDLRVGGRRRRDIIGVYALNLLLIPVNLGGVLKSIQQAITGKRVPFGRTPKVQDRTAAPALYVGGTLALLVVWAAAGVVAAVDGRYAITVLITANVVLLLFGIGRFIGWRHAVEDLLAPLRRCRASRPILPATPPTVGSGDAVLTGLVGGRDLAESRPGVR